MRFADYDVCDLVAFNFFSNFEQKEVSIIYDCYYDNIKQAVMDFPCRFTIKKWENIYVRDINDDVGYKTANTIMPFDIIKEKELNEDGDLSLLCIGKQWEELLYKFIRPIVLFEIMECENNVLDTFPLYYNPKTDMKITLQSVNSGKELLHQLAIHSSHRYGSIIDWESILHSMSCSWFGHRRVFVVHEDIHLLSDCDLKHYCKIIKTLFWTRKEIIFIFSKKDYLLINKRLG